MTDVNAKYLSDCLNCYILDENNPTPRQAWAAALAFLVLHASLNRYLDCPRRHARRCPCWPASCLLANPGQDSRAVPYQERDLPVQVERWLQRFVHYVTASRCTSSE